MQQIPFPNPCVYTQCNEPIHVGLLHNW